MAPSSQDNGPRRGSCSSISRAFCTLGLLILWGLVALDVFLCHIAISEVVPPLQDMPSNLQKGFNEVLKFSSLEAEATVVRTEAERALAHCDVTKSQCSALPDPSPLDRASNTTAEKSAIEDAFSRTLNSILKVATDDIFGTEELNSTAAELQQIVSDLKAINATEAPCIGSNALYCNILDNADQIVEGTSDVTAEIDKFCNTKEMQTWEDYAKYMKLLHSLPYVMVMAMVAFTMFWWKDAACCCCGGSFCGFVYMVVFALLWLIFFAFSMIVCVAGYAIRNRSDEIMIKGVFAKDVSLKKLLDHVQAQYPEFWTTVFGDLVHGLELFNKAFLIFVLVCMVILAYALSLCLCTPYTDRNYAKESS